MRTLLLLLTALSLGFAGCSSGNGDGGGAGNTGGNDEPCMLRTQLSGAATANIDWSGPGYCGSARGSTDLMTLMFGFGSTLNDTDLGVFVRVPLPSPSETGAKPAVLEVGKGCGLVGNDCQESWKTPDGACTLEIGKHEFHHSDQLFDYYTLEGSGTCTAPATSLGGTEVSIAPFSLAIAHLWDKAG